MDPNNLLELLECPVCMNYILPPIKQCQNGHLFCQPCGNKMKQCPICRIIITNNRNRAMETVARSIDFPCKFRHFGCKKKVKYDEKLQHDKSCAFNPCYPCVVAKCNWRGPCHDVPHHFESQHKIITNHSEGAILFPVKGIENCQGCDQWMMSASRHGRCFVLVLSGLPPDKFIVLVFLVGNQQESESYRWALEVGGSKSVKMENMKPTSILDFKNLSVSGKNDFTFSRSDATLLIWSNLNQFELCKES
ncbi:Hypothetical predicted protein [Cloeon dipterum]|uniref:RING-type E3 ubiquitin transferase n=2 Tax=Cloeon dipterum TaxID=197152 RepID=A0A8S1CHS8_9INSE|nr:Hypothetical predicted protein [Cloeon dipterum]